MIYEVQEESGQKKLNALAGKATTGIPLGTWLAFENDSAPNIEWIRAGTTFDVNAYPALAMYLGSDKVPERFDHNRLGKYEDITLSTNSSNPTIMQYDGILVFAGAVEGAVYVWINGERITRDRLDGSYASGGSINVSFNKGDTIYITYTGYSAKVAYYTHPLFIKATPTSSNSDYEGTLNAVRQYVTNSNSYSTDEVWTGGYWIDGDIRKKIYKKTLTTTNKGTVERFNFDQTILNVDIIIKAEGFIKCSSGTFNGMQFQIPRGGEEINFTNSTGVMSLVGRSTGVNADFAQITVEYTKITD